MSTTATDVVITRSLSFTVYGHPEPQGSIRAFMPKGWNRPVLTTANAKMKPWRQQITGCAQDAMLSNSFYLIDRPVAIQACLLFTFAKPPSVKKKRLFPTVKPDADKLIRAVLDALTGTVFADDSQVTDLVVSKRYGQPERVEITISEAT